MDNGPANTHRNLEDFAGIASDWFWETDADHRFTYFSSRIEEVTQLPASRFIGQKRDSIGTDEDFEDQWLQHFEDLNAHRPFRDFEYSLTRPKDGSLGWVRIAGQPHFAPDGTFLG